MSRSASGVGFDPVLTTAVAGGVVVVAAAAAFAASASAASRVAFSSASLIAAAFSAAAFSSAALIRAAAAFASAASCSAAAFSAAAFSAAAFASAAFLSAAAFVLPAAGGVGACAAAAAATIGSNERRRRAPGLAPPGLTAEPFSISASTPRTCSACSRLMCAFPCASRCAASPCVCICLCHGKTWSAMCSGSAPGPSVWYRCGVYTPRLRPLASSITLCTLRVPPTLCEPTWSAICSVAYWHGIRSIVMLKLMRMFSNASAPSGDGSVEVSRLSTDTCFGAANSAYSWRTSQKIVTTARTEIRPPTLVASVTSFGTLRKKWASRRPML